MTKETIGKQTAFRVFSGRQCVSEALFMQLKARLSWENPSDITAFTISDVNAAG